MPSQIIATLKSWNIASYHSNNEETDKKFVEVLLICFIGSGNLVNDNVNQKSLRLVQSKVFQIMLLSIEFRLHLCWLIQAHHYTSFQIFIVSGWIITSIASGNLMIISKTNVKHWNYLVACEGLSELLDDSRKEHEPDYIFSFYIAIQILIHSSFQKQYLLWQITNKCVY